MNKRGFTLAEVLITLGIIGVVAAITVPAVMVHNREVENTTKLKKIYSTITQAYTRAVTEFGTPEHWDLKAQNSPEGAENIKKILSPYFTVKPDNLDGDVWRDDNTILLNKSTGPNIGANEGGKYSTFAVVDGMSLAFNVENKDCEGVFGENRALQHVCATFTVDVNGSKLPNQFGYDIFKFYITKYGIQPYGTQADETTPFETNCTLDSDGYGCTAWVVFRSNMDYLHCDDLQWNGKYSCKGLVDSKYNIKL